MKNKTNGYFFISHSSMDLKKVRIIRNKIEDECGNPILFYLKCLDHDTPTGEDEKELKSLISREIKARHRFILCKSKYTEPPLCSDWIAWEKEEVRKMTSNNLVQYYEIDIENDNFLEEVDKIVSKQCNVLIVSTYEITGVSELINYLKDRNISAKSFHESSEMREELTNRYGFYTKEIVKNELNSFDPENNGIIIFLDSIHNMMPTFLQIVSFFTSRYQPYTTSLQYTLEDKISGEKIKEIYEKIKELITS